MKKIHPMQLSLSVSLRDDATFENFYAGDNAQLLEVLKRQLDPMGEQFVFLWGAPGAGCSHLLQAACHHAEHYQSRAVFLPLEELGYYSPQLLDALEQLDLICIDNVQSVLGRKRWEEALFHFFNRVRDAGKRLVITADAPPRQLNVQLPDLASRLSWGMVYQVTRLDDEQKIQALQLRARERGLQLSDEVARYILHRSPRAMNELFGALERLDRASLSAQRKLTIPFVKEAMGW